MNYLLLSILILGFAHQSLSQQVYQNATPLFTQMMTRTTIPKPILTCMSKIPFASAVKCRFNAWSDWNLGPDQQVYGSIRISNKSLLIPVHPDGRYNFTGNITMVFANEVVFDMVTGDSKMIHCCSLWDTFKCLGELVKEKCGDDEKKGWDKYLNNEARLGDRYLMNYSCVDYPSDTDKCQVQLSKASQSCIKKLPTECDQKLNLTQAFTSQLPTPKFHQIINSAKCCDQWQATECALTNGKSSCSSSEFEQLKDDIGKTRRINKFCLNVYKKFNATKLCDLIG